MSERWVSGSQLKLAMICPAALVLPRSNKSYSENAKKAAEFGTKAHTYIETGVILPGMEDWAAKADRARLYPEKGFHESIGWYNPETEEFGLKFVEPENRKHRDYAWLPESAIPGTLDYICPLKDGRWWVDDLKTGAGMFLPGPDSAQMLFAATVLSHVYACEVISSITWIPRYPKDQQPERKKVTITRKFAAEYKVKLDALYADHLLEKRRRLAGGRLRMIENEGCRFCKSAGDCEVGKKVKDEIRRRKEGH